MAYLASSGRPSAKIIGEAPNEHGIEKYDTRSGKRLESLMLGTRLDWWNVYQFYPEKWSLSEARYNVRKFITRHDQTGDRTCPFILLGAKVCHAFELPQDREWLGWYRTAAHRHPMIAMPHPSGRNIWWNDSRNVRAASNLLLDITQGRVPYVEHASIKDEKA